MFPEQRETAQPVHLALAEQQRARKEEFKNKKTKRELKKDAMAGLAIPIAPNLAPFDPNVSNGTCYAAPGRVAASGYIPCGNAGSPDADDGVPGGGKHVSCCFAGDYCQSSNACYDPDTDNVYIAGCTDAEYKASACPYKSPAYAAQEWVGLVWSCEARQQIDSSAPQAAEEAESQPANNLVNLARNATLVPSQQSGNSSHSSTSTTTSNDTLASSNSTAPGFLVLNQNNNANADPNTDAENDDRVTTASNSIASDVLISWSGCPLPHPGSVVPERMYNMCDPCSPLRDGLFRDKKQLTRVATLPDGIGGVVKWEPGFGPGSPGGSGLVIPEQTKTMSSCAPTMSSTGAAGFGIVGTGVASPTATDGTTEMNSGGDGAAGAGHPGENRTNIIVGSTSAVVIVLLATALAWLLTRRHQRKRQERAVIRETHLALARGPSPPQLMVARGGGGRERTDSTSVGAGAMQLPRGDMSETAASAAGAATFLSPTDSVHSVRIRGAPGQIPRVNGARSTLQDGPVPLSRGSATADTQRWSTVTDLTVNTTTSSMAMTALTTETSTDMMAKTPMSVSTPTASAPLIRKTSTSSLSTFSGHSGEDDEYFSHPKANFQQGDERGVQREDKQDQVQHGDFDADHCGGSSSKQPRQQAQLEENEAARSEAGSFYSSRASHEYGLDGANFDSESLSSYQDATICQLQHVRIRVVEPNTARLLILGKKPNKGAGKNGELSNTDDYE
ncbi:hypothetical protein Micbo1qcDRAFT_171588 [Microdochium bolleyi]|uniref:Uncharacterized protein n=1 Tax=Microdochium bolleyi TaxID=196109 RepID=A0A136JDF4_9PEZI|nr:hypothetical protein Micbo1qcDRAFT_171588 [Microdochium bolleyi]